MKVECESSVTTKVLIEDESDTKESTTRISERGLKLLGHYIKLGS
jgi:hypothetical protein